MPALVYGAGAMGFFAMPYTIIAYPFVFAVMPRLWNVCRRHDWLTLGDFAQGRYDSHWLALAVALTGVLATMPYIALQLVGMETVIGALGVIVAVCVLYIVLGAFLEGIGMLLITVPITLPLVLSYGYDPVWFGVLLVILIELGLIHPPMGMNLFAINAVSKEINIIDIYKGSAPFLIAPLLLIVLMIAFPQIVLWLPAQMN